MADADEELMQDEPFETTLASLQKRTKLLMVLLIVAMVLALGTAGFAFTSVNSLKKQLTAAKEVVQKVDSGGENAVKPIGADAEVGVIHPLGNFVVNLLDPGNLRYVNCRIELEVGDSTVVRQINAREAQFKDAVISLLGNKTYEDVMGLEGKTRVREELMVRFNRLVTEGQIARVYLTEFVVQ
jgi:flagellar FliL protein